MRVTKLHNTLLLVLYLLFAMMLSSCSYYSASNNASSYPSYDSRLPHHIDAENQKVIIVDPRIHAWGAYGPDGDLVRAGLATAGANWCPDLNRPCHTGVGVFYINSLGSPNCKSTIFPIPKGGAPMPYCMFFNRDQALHGSPEGELGEGNYSHGCVRLHVPDAEWIRYNFASIGTKVIVKPY